MQLCCTIAFVKFDTHRAGPRWTGGGTPTVREFLRPRKFPRNTTSVGWFVPTQNIFAGECLRRFSPPQNLCLGGQGSGRAGNRRRQNTQTPPPPGGVGVGGDPPEGGRGGTRGVKKTRFRGYYFGADPLCGITRGPPKSGFFGVKIRRKDTPRKPPFLTLF